MIDRYTRIPSMARERRGKGLGSSLPLLLLSTPYLCQLVWNNRATTRV